MLQFLSKPCKYIKSKFVRNPSSTSPSPPSKPNEFSNLEYENLFMELLEKVEKGSSWGELQGFLIIKKLDRQLLAKWLRSFGEGWLEQPEIHQELARRLGLLGRVATGELAEVARSLSERLSCVEEKENQDTNKSINQPIRAESESNEQSIMSMSLFNQAVQQFHSQDYQGALDSLVKAKQIYPDDYRIWVLQGLVLEKFEKLEKAIASYDQALKFQPDDYITWNNRGLVLERLESLEEAIASFDQALKLQPDDYLTWNNRGLALERLGSLEEAITSYDQALKLQPDAYLTWYNRGIALEKLGSLEEAIASFDQALKLQPDAYRTWVKRGILAGALSTYNDYYQKHFVELFYLEMGQVYEKLITTLENASTDRYLNHFQESLSVSQSLLLKTFTNFDTPKLIAQIQQPPPEKLNQLIQQPFASELINLIQQPLSEQVKRKLEQDCLSHPPRFNSQLNLRGYEGKLASYQAELDKAICRDTHPLGWGILHHAIGRAHYSQGRMSLR